MSGARTSSGQGAGSAAMIEGRARDADAPRVAVIGGGLAGLAAAVQLAEAGLAVELFEARHALGGRAGSFQDAESGEAVDHCQHVSLGCCTYLADFARRTNIEPFFRRERTLHFVDSGGRRSDLWAAGWLPAPLQLGAAFFGLSFLSRSERLAVAATLRRLVREMSHPLDDQRSIGQWLADQNHPQRAVELFWTPILVSALSETLERASLYYAQKVFRDAFFGHRLGWEVLMPTLPLGELYGERLAPCLARLGVAVRHGAAVRRVALSEGRCATLAFAEGAERAFDFVVVAVPWRRARELFGEGDLARLPELEGAAKLEAAPITAVHLWFEREITRLPHAVLPGRLSQWLFRRPLASNASTRNRTTDTGTSSSAPQQGVYYQVVISASGGLAGRPREEIVSQVTSELAAAFPQLDFPRLLRGRVVTEHAAVFSPLPGVDRWRPSQTTSHSGLFLAGDWTQTKWPATMEGAVRSGYFAARALLHAAGRPAPQLVAELPRPALARWLVGIR